MVVVRLALEAAGVEFTNGDQPGVRLTTDLRPAGASKSDACAKAVRRKTAKATEKKR